MLRQLEASASWIVAQSQASAWLHRFGCSALPSVCHGFKPQFKDLPGTPRLVSAILTTHREIPCPLIPRLHVAIF